MDGINHYCQIITDQGVTPIPAARIENHAEDIRLSTLNRYAEALGKKLHVVMQ